MKSDWQEVVLGQVDVVLAGRAITKKPHRDFKARIQLSAVPALTEAAKLRNMSVSAYTRRACLAFAAYDLGLNLADLLEDEPSQRLKSDPPTTNLEEGGRGHGNWVIQGLE
jgi:hypothetical protein